MASKTEIANMALMHLKSSKPIGNLETENSLEARACRTFFSPAVRTALRDFPWPFATDIVPLQLVEEAPNTEWAYAYQYPVNAVRLWRIPSGIRNDNRQSRVPYKIIRKPTGGQVILTDKEDARMEMTTFVSNTSEYPDDFTLALSYKLAMLIAPVITGGDPFKLTEFVESRYVMALSIARANAINEEQADQEPESEMIRAREA